MATTNSISQQLLDLLATRNFHPEMLGQSGLPSDAEDAKTFTFDYVSGTGKNYGTMVIVLDSDNEMKIMYGDNLGRTMEGDDKTEFFDFIQHLSKKATQNRWTHSIVDINQLKHTMQGMAAIQEGLFEGYYGTKKISYSGEPTQARMQIMHSQPLGEGDARYRHIDKIFIETADGERFKLGFKSLSGARAMLEHVRQGGKPYDIRGCHISETVNEIAVLSRFNRASANRILEGVTQELVTEAQGYYQTLRENLKHLGTGRGYKTYFESWHPATINEQEGVVDNIKTLFIEQSIDSRIEAALPLLARIQQRGQEMKEADIFESWINRLTEGTWTLPETPEQLDKLKALMTKELVVGPDATNATEQLYDLVGDDILFDRLGDLAARDPRANAWNDSEVMQRFKELGIELPVTTDAPAPVEPQAVEPAPAPAAPAPAPAPQQPVAEDEMDEMIDYDTLNQLGAHAVGMLGKPGAMAASAAGGAAIGGAIGKGIEKTVNYFQKKKEDNAMNAMRKAAGLKVNESLLDESGEALEHILGRFKHEVKNFIAGQELSDDLYHSLYDYWKDNGEMPYGVAKARDGDPFSWVPDKLATELGIQENLIAPMAMPVATEGSTCNMTTEGEYCPEHGLMECGMGMPAGIMGEGAGSKWYVTHELRTGDADRVAGPFADQHQAQAWMNDNLPPHWQDDGERYDTIEDNLDEGFREKLAAAALAGSMAFGAAGAGATGLPGGSSSVDQSAGKPVATQVAPTDAGFVNRVMAQHRAMEQINPQYAKDHAGLNIAMVRGIGGGSDVKNQQWAQKTAQLLQKYGVKLNEGNDDPMNYNGAITGSYYESKDGDALLARIKSLALLK